MAREKTQNKPTNKSEQTNSLAEYIVGCIDTYRKEFADTLIYRSNRAEALEELRLTGAIQFQVNENRNTQVKWIESKTANTLKDCSKNLTKLETLMGQARVETFAQFAATNPEKSDELRASIESVQSSIDALLPKPVDQPPLLVFLLEEIRQSLAEFKEPTQTVADSEVVKSVRRNARE